MCPRLGLNEFNRSKLNKRVSFSRSSGVKWNSYLPKCVINRVSTICRFILDNAHCHHNDCLGNNII
ncbi:CLUMA_CG018634, isoform A [Clunio marinus]|uniref:CLUMA_CG018634, isoform A n=1 Tax=Clunio marinus TaxID=568069 RepID=A0A1J1J0V5_9DIPT|nr:CLUMA_CG018634, isoform A [Clunio marinus]